MLLSEHPICQVLEVKWVKQRILTSLVHHEMWESMGLSVLSFLKWTSSLQLANLTLPFSCPWRRNRYKASLRWQSTAGTHAAQESLPSLTIWSTTVIGRLFGKELNVVITPRSVMAKNRTLYRIICQKDWNRNEDEELTACCHVLQTSHNIMRPSSWCTPHSHLTGSSSFMVDVPLRPWPVR